MSSSTNQASSAFPSSTPSTAYLQESKAILATAFQRVRRTASEVIEIGKRLLRVKELTAHGEWAAVVESLGISIGIAERAMRKSRRFYDLQNLAAAVVSLSQLEELECLDDKDLRSIDAGETVRGISLETIGSLKVREIRAALRGGDQGGKSSGKPSKISPVLGTMPEDANVATSQHLQSSNVQAPKRATSPGLKSKPASTDGLQPLQAGDRIKSLYAGRGGSVVRTYADGSASVLWDDGEPQYEGLAHERVPRHMLAFVEHSATTARNESDGAKLSRQTQESGENDLAAESLSPGDIRGLAQDIARQLNGTAAEPAESLLKTQPTSLPEICPAVYDMRQGSFNGAELSILQHEGRAWLILEEIAAVVGDTPEKVAAIEASIGECFDLNFPSGHYATVRFASTSLTARILDVHAVCFLEEALGAEFVQWFSGQCRAVRPAIQPDAQPEEHQRADYLDQLRELHYELYNMKCLIASQAKAIQVMGDDLQEEKVYPLVDLSKIAFGLTEQLDALLDRHDEVLSRLRDRLLKTPGADDTLPESVWLGLVDELSAEREGWGNEDMWRLSQHADCLSRYAGRSPEASAALRHLKAFAARQGAVLYDHLYEGELPGEGRMAFAWMKGVAPQRAQRGRESVRAH